MLEQLLSISVDVILFLQTQLSFLTPVMRFFTFLGNEDFYLIIMPIFLWAIDYNFGVRLGMIMLLSGGFNTIFKFSFHQPRPYWTSTSISNLDVPHISFGLPSGHSQNAASLFGTLATWVKQKWLKVLLVFIIFMVALSRLFLGVHSLQDITLGLIIGGLIVFVAAKSGNKIADFLKNRSVTIRLLIGLLISLSILFAAFGISSVQKNNFTIPNAWEENTKFAGHEEDLNPYELNGILTSSGALFGVIAGSIWINESGGFEANQGIWWKRLLRFIVGLIGVLIFWKILGDIFPRNNDFISYGLRYFRYALVGFWIAGLAPKLFGFFKIDK